MLLRIGLLALLLILLVSCRHESTYSFKTDQIRLLFNAFQGRSFGTSSQAPVLIISEFTGKLRGKSCLLLQISYATTDQLIIQPNKGLTLSSNDADISDAVFNKYKSCAKQKRSCLIGILDTKKPEIIAQIELLNPNAGGLLIGALYKGDCSSEDTFDSSNILARQALAIGKEFRSDQETTSTDGGTSSEKTSSEQTVDAGSSE